MTKAIAILKALWSLLNLAAVLAGKMVEAAGFSETTSRRIKTVCMVLDWLPVGPIGSLTTIVVMAVIIAGRWVLARRTVDVVSSGETVAPRLPHAARRKCEAVAYRLAL